MSIELPVQVLCEICEGLERRDARYALIASGDCTRTFINPWQYEIGHSLIVTKRHVATLLDLTDAEAKEALVAARRVARALLKTFAPLGILTFQNNGVYSGQSVPHYHLHVVPRQPGSDWGIGPPQLAVFEDAGRRQGTPHGSSTDAERHRRAEVDVGTLHRTAERIRAQLD